MDFCFDEQFQIMIEKLRQEPGLKKESVPLQVLLLGHMNPDGDAAGSVMALAHYIHANYPQVQAIPYLSQKLDQGPKMMVKEDMLFDPFREPEVQIAIISIPVQKPETAANTLTDVTADPADPANPANPADAADAADAADPADPAGLADPADPADPADILQKTELRQPYGVIVCDTATRARMIGLEYYEKAAASIVLDHHASNEGYGDVNFTKISESCAANVFAMLDPDKLARAAEEPHPNAADYLYLGILHDTGGFARADVDIMTAAAALLRLGVDHRWLMRTLNTQTMDDKHREALLLEMAWRADVPAGEIGTEANGGPIAYVIVDRECAGKNHITYEDIHPISGILRDCADIELGFTMYEEEPDIWRCSFRSDGKWVNVNELLTPFGGGGHAGAAGLRIETKNQPELLGRILERLREMRGDSQKKRQDDTQEIKQNN